MFTLEMLDETDEEALDRLGFWRQAALNQARYNQVMGREPCAVLRPASAARIWQHTEEFGQTWGFYDQGGHELFKVGQRDDGIWRCWECDGACCGHIMEALRYFGGQNEVDGI